MMKRILCGILACVMMLVTFTSVNAATIHNYDDWKTNEGANGSKTKVSDYITRLEGGEELYKNNTYNGPYVKHSVGNLKDGITEEVNIGLDLKEFEEGEKFYVSNSISYDGSYSTENFIVTTKTADGFEITSSLDPEFDTTVTENGVYTYQWKWTAENNKAYVVFTLLKDGEVVKSATKVDANALKLQTGEGDDEYVSLEVTEEAASNITPGYIWFLGIEVEKGVNVYSHLPEVETVPEITGDVEVDEESVNDLIDEALEKYPELAEAAKLNDVTLAVESAEVEAPEAEELAKLEAVIPGAKVAQLLNITVSVNAGEESVELTELTKPLTLTVTIPELPEVAEGYARTYYILRQHGEDIERLDAVLSEDGKTLSFASDKFSTYALVYVDNEVAATTPDDNPNTLDTIVNYLAVGGISLLVIAGTALYVSKKRFN